MKKVLILVDDTYEELELWYPKMRLQEEGIGALIAGPKSNHTYIGKHGYPCHSDMELEEPQAQDFDALLIPGGYAPDRLRRYHKVLELVRDFHQQKKCISFICHGGWVLISAKILKGKKVTSFSAIKDDMENAGAIWIDQEVVIDHNLVSARTPEDLPAFVSAILQVIKKQNNTYHI